MFGAIIMLIVSSMNFKQYAYQKKERKVGGSLLKMMRLSLISEMLNRDE